MVYENLFQYTPIQHDLIAQSLTVTYTIMIAALLYFAVSLKTNAPKYRTSGILSIVVMTSAFIILFYQSQSWQNAFTFSPEIGKYVLDSGADLFSNGYRYLNWLIDVPMLLFQILFIVNLSQKEFITKRNWFFISGAAMILLGYVGQFYEVTDPKMFINYGIISSIFFIHILYLIYGIIKGAIKDLSKPAGKIMASIWILFLFSWTLYPIAYYMPILGYGEWGVVARQIIFSVADVLSKVIYGILLMRVGQIRSKEDGYKYS